MAEKRTAPPMMTCGHAANGVRVMPEGDRIPSCVICSNTEVAANPPDLTTRLARCTYYGKKVPATFRDKGGCDTRSNWREEPCVCEKASSTELWFFEHKSDADFDRFYCGCWGYD